MPRKLGGSWVIISQYCKSFSSSCSKVHQVLVIVQESGASERKIVKLNINQIPSTGPGELSCSAGSFRNIPFIVHQGAHNSVLFLQPLHGRNSQTQFAAVLFLKRNCNRTQVRTEEVEEEEEDAGWSRSVHQNAGDWCSHLSVLHLHFFHLVQLYSCQTLLVQHSRRRAPTGTMQISQRKHTHPTHAHTQKKLFLPATAVPLSQDLLDTVNYMLWVDSWCLCNYPRLHSGIKSEWGLEKFIKRTCLNSGICLQNSMRPGGPAASWLAL